MNGIPILNNEGEVIEHRFLDKPWAHKSMIISYVTDPTNKDVKHEIQNIVCKPVRVGLYRQPLKFQLILHTEDFEDAIVNGKKVDPKEQIKGIFQKDKYYSIMCSYSNDPIMYFAGTPVSLGYYAFKFSIDNAKCVNLNPTVFQISGTNMRRKIHLPIR